MRLRKQLGFAAVEVIMILITVAAIVGGVIFVISEGTSDEANEATQETMSEEEETQTSNDDNPSGELNVAERDKERRTHLQTIQTDLEAYFARNGNYPKASDYANPIWRVGNLVSDSANESAYTTYDVEYNVRPNTCDNEALPCVSYDISVDLEFDGVGNNDSDADTADAVEQSLN